MRLVWKAMLLLVWLPASASDDLFGAVNRVRQDAGLPGLTASATLTRAAARHADYLDAHRDPAAGPAGMSAHRQRRDLPGFTGEVPGDRALAAGYPHRSVLENVSMGYDTLDEALEGLMSAIYHRLTFLDLVADELGAASGERSRVFLLGRRDLRATCAAPPDEARFRTPVDCAGRPMTREAYDRLCANLPVDALSRPSHPISCPDGRRLDAAYMARICRRPPPAARFQGTGRYYLPCGDATRLDADWFDALCAAPPAAARSRGSGRYVEMCQPRQRVAAEWFADYCAMLPVEDIYSDSGTYRRPCAGGADVRVEFLDELEDRVLHDRPELVTWPPDGAVDVAPAFFVEAPDPLPDLEVSGNPVSLQVNPARFDEVALSAFRLYRRDGDAAVPVEARLLDAHNDPNGLLTTHEFALFPLQRLEWGARYAASAELVLDGHARRVSWQFETRGGPVPVLRAPHDRQVFAVRPGEPVWLYLPPRQGEPHTVLKSRTRYPVGGRVALSIIDPNTAEITVEARACGRVTLEFEPRRVVELVVADCRG